MANSTLEMTLVGSGLEYRRVIGVAKLLIEARHTSKELEELKAVTTSYFDGLELEGRVRRPITKDETNLSFVFMMLMFSDKLKTKHEKIEKLTKNHDGLKLVPRVHRVLTIYDLNEEEVFDVKLSGLLTERVDFQWIANQGDYQTISLKYKPQGAGFNEYIDILRLLLKGRHTEDGLEELYLGAVEYFSVHRKMGLFKTETAPPKDSDWSIMRMAKLSPKIRMTNKSQLDNNRQRKVTIMDISESELFEMKLAGLWSNKD